MGEKTKTKQEFDCDQSSSWLMRPQKVFF